MQPSDIQAINADFNRAMQLHGAGRVAEAQALYGAILARAPGHAGALHLLGVGHFQQGRFAEGVPFVKKALALKPDYVEAHNNLANALKALGRFDDALLHYERALAYQPNFPPGHYNRGNALAALYRYEEALASYDQAVALDPNYAHAFNNRGIALYELQRFGESVASCDRALALDPTLAEAWMNRANTERDMHRFDAALADYGQAMARRGDYSEAVFNRSLLHLLRSDFAEGWRDYEQRWRFDKFIARSSNGLSRAVIERLSFANHRAAFAGKRCLIVGEQGIGDEVMFAGLLRDVARDAASLTCLCSAKLLGLFAQSFPAIRFIGLREPVDHMLGEFDLVVAAGSLGYVYRQTPADFSGLPYLQADADRVAAWRRRLDPEDQRPLIGLSWRGGTADTRGANRSLSLEALLPLFDAVDARFVSLQYGDVAGELSAFAARHGRQLLQFPRADIEKLADLAALVVNMDKVVSVQTALIHLCGALGQDCLTLVPSRPEWRYGLTGEEMLWYKSVRLLRQQPSGDWSDVVARAAALLAAG